MRFLNILLLLLCTQVQAEKLIFSNNNEQVDITADVVIDNQNGNVTVTTLGGEYLIVDGSGPVILGFYPNDYEITLGETIDVNWTVVNADSCVASTTSGSASWSGNKSNDDGNKSQSNVAIAQLPSTLRLVCSNDNDSVAKTFQIIEQPVGSTGNPTIDSFRVNGQSSFVTVSSELNTASFTWSATDVSSCTASASPSLSGWSGTKATSGSQDITITRDTTVTLSCDSVTPRSVSIDYSEGGNPNCTSSVYPPLAGSKVEMTYAEANDGFPFGENTGASLQEIFGTSQFLALSNFSTNNIDYRRRIATFPSPTGGSNQPWYGVSWSISECPGDFTAAAKCEGVLFPYDEIFVSTKQSGEPSFYCVIQPGVSYYLNFVHDILPYDATQGRCSNLSHSSCSIFTSEVADGQ